MRILIALTYYRPYISGLTIYAQRLGQELAKRGHSVTILTSRHDKHLPPTEKRDNVTIVRVPVAFRLSKGVIMPTFGFVATKLVRQTDVLCLHLPQFDASGLALRGHLMNKPVTLTYHCDLQLPPSLFNRLVDKTVHVSNLLAAQWADAIVAYTEDFARHSIFLSRYLSRVKIIPPPVDMPLPTSDEVAAFRDKWSLNERVVIGFAGRMAAEKGIEYLLQALPRVREAYPAAHLVLAGPCDPIGERVYIKRLEPLFEKMRGHWTLLGTLSDQEWNAFLSSCECLVLPSVNSTESFGLVQVEAMLCGTPSIASDLPGVRQPVLQTGMGEVVPVGDSAALAEAIIQVVGHKANYVRPREEIAERWNTERTAEEYEALFERLLEGRRRRGDGETR